MLGDGVEGDGVDGEGVEGCGMLGDGMLGDGILGLDGLGGEGGVGMLGALGFWQAATSKIAAAVGIHRYFRSTRLSCFVCISDNSPLHLNAS